MPPCCATTFAPCEVLTSQGRSFPVKIEYLPRAVGISSASRCGMWRRCRMRPRRGTETPGDLLVFMLERLRDQPHVAGAAGRTLIARLRDVSAAWRIAAGRGRSGRSRATTRERSSSPPMSPETSLTIDGVTAVIDSGLARGALRSAPRDQHAAHRKRSAASADQRAGRVGRTAPGVCVRLWTEREHAQRPAQELPEVRSASISPRSCSRSRPAASTT